MKNVNRQIIAKKDEENVVPVEIFEQSIVEMAKAMKKLSETRLKQDALVTLIARTTGESRGSIESVINCLDMLEELYLKPKKK